MLDNCKFNLYNDILLATRFRNSILARDGFSLDHDGAALAVVEGIRARREKGQRTALSRFGLHSFWSVAGMGSFPSFIGPSSFKLHSESVIRLVELHVHACMHVRTYIQ